MKIIKQKTLYFSEGKSDKVYEVDLCESGSDLFIINFRFGRRGASLREGTKTVFPIAYDEALVIFNSLVSSKENKGYSEELSLVANEVNQVNIELNVGREETIIKYLKDAVLGVYVRDWKVSRIIMRAGFLNTVKAIPYINHFIDSKDAFEQYASIYSLSKFNDVSIVNKIFDVFESKGFIDKVGRVSASYILKLGDESSKSKVRDQALVNLPEELKVHIGNTDAFFNALSIYFLKDKDIDGSVLYYCYLFSINDISFKKQLYTFLDKAPLKVNFFKSIRYIYRASHILNDVSFFALTSKRIAISKPGYTSNYLYVNNEWTNADTEKQKTNPSIAFSKKTKKYFNKTTYQNIYDISKTNKTLYVEYAKSLLVSLDDALDNAKEDVQYHYSYNNETRKYNTEKRVFPKYHEFLVLMYIVYGSSTRLQHQSNKWFYLESDTNNLPREEALTKLWDSKPDEVVYILANANSEIAVEFALRIIKDNSHFLENIDDELLEQLVSHYHPRVLDVILDIVEQRFRLIKPESSLLIGLIKANNDRANTLGFNWLKKYESDFFVETSFIERLLLIGKENVVDYLKEVFDKSIKYNEPLNIENLNSLFNSPSIFTLEYLIEVNNLIGNTNFGKLLSSVSEEKIKVLANSNIDINKLFAANLAKQNVLPTYQLFKDTVDGYINSESPQLRQVGIELLSHFPDEFLLENHYRISAFCFSEYDEVREAIQPTVEKLIRLDENFKNNLFKSLIRGIETTETYEGLHKNCYTLLTTNYKQYLSSIPQENIFGLLLSNYDYAQKLGEPLFNEHVDIETLFVNSIVQLANSDIFTIRTIVKDYFKNHVPKINYELEAALLIFNSDWEDIITWACTYFKEHIKSENWTTNMLLYACDHTKMEVQYFGRKMITQHFSDEKGLPLLLKLQEHPTKAMQFFVTNYLDNYAKDNEEVILKLETYFKTTLFNINENRVAKTRIYTFLEQESIKNKSVAIMTIRLIEAVLGTNTITDTSNNIDILLTIAEAHPDIEIPLLIKQN
ncbi:hypothetical protein [uncultured Lacinutrix sp.]|uniref:hypothetical protein n=1 Tax=uncultured Lacinutrix sp. TaxID=574032 RepID=UPI0026187986|nr:hypothetical protein [uncultured Lacinutrix sp.]